MTQAYNLSQLANNVNSSGQLAASGLQSGAAASNLGLVNFSFVESGGKLYIKYMGTAVCSIDSSGDITALANVIAYGTP
jgi:hypothetical protein